MTIPTADAICRNVQLAIDTLARYGYGDVYEMESIFRREDPDGYSTLVGAEIRAQDEYSETAIAQVLYQVPVLVKVLRTRDDGTVELLAVMRDSQSE